MEKNYTFDPNFQVIDKISGKYSIEQLDNEVSVFSASPDFVRKNCGPIANSILDKIPKSFFDEAKALNLYPNIDVRIHRLYPGDIPAYPGWHTDGEHRDNYHSQPDLDKVPRHKHIICSVSTNENGVSNTEFINKTVKVKVVDPNKDSTLWGQVHKHIEENEDLTMHKAKAKDGDITLFDSFTLHRATAARTRGWRLYFRASMWHKPYLGVEGKISKQEQIYKVCEGSGW